LKTEINTWGVPRSRFSACDHR